MPRAPLPPNELQRLAIGCNHFLTKPVDRQNLIQVCRTLMSGAAETFAEDELAVVQRNSIIVDRDALFSAIDSDFDLLTQLVDLFREASSASLQQASEALHSQDAVELANAAHSLKGAVGTFKAQQAFDTAAQLESYSRIGELQNAGDCLERLYGDVARLIEVLSTLTQQPAEQPVT